VRSDCSRISGLFVESRGLRAMMESARGVPIVRAGCQSLTAAMVARLVIDLSPRRSDRWPFSPFSEQISGRVIR